MVNITEHVSRDESDFQELLSKRMKKIEAAGKTKEVDETRYEDGTSVKLITIDSAIADVSVIASNSLKIEAHLYGQLDEEEEVGFEINRVDDLEVNVKLNFTGCCYYSKLKLDIIVPHKGFKMIDVKSLSADVTLDEEILAESLKVRTKVGSVETMAKLTEIDITTMSGDVEICMDAMKDIDIRVITTTGDVSMEFYNIGAINLSEKTKRRNVKNRHKGGLGHIANVDISTLSGNIRIR